MTEMTDLLEIKTAIVEIRGEIRTMTEAMRSGDRDSASGVKLLAQVVENLAKNQSDQRDDLKEALTEFRTAVKEIGESITAQSNGISVRLETRLREHETEDAPHAKTIGVRLDALEHDAIRVRVVIALLTFVGWGGIAAIVKLTGGG